jgi:hypothetical protein
LAAGGAAGAPAGAAIQNTLRPWSRPGRAAHALNTAFVPFSVTLWPTSSAQLLACSSARALRRGGGGAARDSKTATTLAPPAKG